MLSIFIMLFIAVGIAAGISFAIITMINTAQTSLTIQANQARLQTISNFVRSGLNVDAGRVLLPVEEKDGRYLARVPGNSPFATTSSGRRIVYCPAFTADAVSGTQIVNDFVGGGNESYAVDIVDLDGRKYISAGAPAFADPTVRPRLGDLGIIALMLSPQPNNEGDLKCSDVTLSTEDSYTFLIDGGSVTPIFTVATEGKSAVFVIEGAENVRDDYGRVVKSLDDVKAFADKYALTDITVKIADDAHVRLSSLAALLDGSFGKTIRLGPVDASVNVELDAGAEAVDSHNAYLNVTGRLFVEDVAFSGLAANGPFDVAMQAAASGEVNLKNTAVGGLFANGGRVAAIGSTVVNPQHGDLTTFIPIMARGGTISFRSTANPSVVAPAAFNVFSANSGTVELWDGVRVRADTSAVFASRNGGRFTSYTSEADAPIRVQVDKGTGTYEFEAYRRVQLVSNTCGEGDTECVVECPVGKTVVSGGCGSGNGLPALEFGPRSATEYGCTFPVGVLETKATAACD